MPNLYADIGAFERRYLAGQTLDGNDELNVLALIGGASRSIDAECRRKFYAETLTKYLKGSGARTQEFEADLQSLSALQVDADDDRIYEYVLVQGTDYELVNIDADDEAELPYNAARLLQNAKISAFPRIRRAVKATGRFGYSDIVLSVLTAAGVAVTGTLADATDTTLVTSAVAFPAIAPGMTLRIESEDIFVLPGSRVSPFNVQRGVNGTTAAAHTSAPLSVYVYEPDVVEAVFITTGRLRHRKDAPLLTAIMAPGLGSMQLSTQLDPDIRMALARLKRFGRL